MWEESWQDLVFVWIYGEKKRWEIKMTPTFVTPMATDANTKGGVGVRRKDTLFCLVHVEF